ncbi:RHS repeat domain-containing protein, partial [Parachitinimonas caeni]
IYYYHPDQIGTPRELTNAAGQIVWRAEYLAWGNTLKLHWLTDAEPVEQPLRFQGQYYDEETGLHYNRFRYYDPDLGRFVSQDPILLKGGINLYSYALNPVSWVDPLGLQKKKGGGKGCPCEDEEKNCPAKVAGPTFLEQVKNSSVRTGKKFQGAEIYKFTDKVKIGDTTFRKGDYFYLDNLHKDHYETFSSNNTSKGVFNLDGTLNEKKTKSAEKRTGPGC